MKLLATLTGGYKRVIDRLLTLQSETVTFIDAQLGSLGFDMVLQGCQVTDNHNGTVNIAPGIVYVGGTSMRFDGAANVADNGSMAFVTGAPVTSYPSVFGDGSTKNIYSEVKAVIAAQDPTNPTQIKVYTTLYNLQQYIKDQINAAEQIGTVKTVADLTGTFLENFDGTGLGVTPAWLNWALDNGNNGTIGSAGMAIIGVGAYIDPISGVETIYSSNDTGGEIKHTLTPTEAPTPAGLPPGLDGPHLKPEDGHGERVFYVNNPLSTGEDAADGHNNMMPYRAYYRVVKIR